MILKGSLKCADDSKLKRKKIVRFCYRPFCARKKSGIFFAQRKDQNVLICFYRFESFFLEGGGDPGGDFLYMDPFSKCPPVALLSPLLKI